MARKTTQKTKAPARSRANKALQAPAAKVETSGRKHPEYYDDIIKAASKGKGVHRYQLEKLTGKSVKTGFTPVTMMRAVALVANKKLEQKKDKAEGHNRALTHYKLVG